MIPFVRTPHGLMPADMWEALEAKRVATEKALGIEKRNIDLDKLGKQIKHVLKTISSSKLNSMYPCRTCKIITDDSYKSACHEMNVVTCYVAKRFRGCGNWAPRPVVG